MIMIIGLAEGKLERTEKEAVKAVYSALAVGK